MRLRTQHEFLFVGRDEGSFVENYVYDLGEGGHRTGKIFINLEIENNPADAEVIGETIFDTVRKTFFADLQKDPYNRFEDALKDVNKALSQLKNERVSKYIGELNVIIAAVVDKNLYLAECGEAEAYLIRRRFCSTISEGLSDENSEDFFTNIANGTLEDGDFILFSSTLLLRYISKTDLAKIVSAPNLVSTLSELKDYLSSEVFSRVGFIGVSVSQYSEKLAENEKGKIVSHLQKEEEFELSGMRAKKFTNINFTKVSQKLSSIFSKAKNSVDSLKGTVSNAKSRISRRHEPTNKFGFSTWGRDKILGSLIVIVLLLTLGIWWLRGRAAEQENINKYNGKLVEVQEQINSAETTGQYNKEQAGQMLLSAEQTAVEVLNSGYHRAKATELLSAIEVERDKLDGVIRIEPKVLVDLAKKRENVSALGILSLGQDLFVYEYNALYPIKLDQLSDPVTIDDNEVVIGASEFEDQDSLLFYTKAGRLIEYKDSRFSFVTTDEGAYHKGVAVKAYSNKFYILDPENNQIWKYTRGRDNFSAADPYNNGVDIKNGISFAIDGSIYVLNNDTSITKLFGGEKEEFTIKKMPINPLVSPTKIFTEFEMSEFYILEPTENRVMVFIKDDRTGGLTYTSQYVFDNITDIRDMYVDKDTNKMYLVDASKVYEVDLSI